MAPELSAALSEINGKLDSLTKTVGKESDDGKSGTGLVGEVRRQSQDLKSLTSLRDRGLGAVAVIVLVLSLLGLNFRQAIVSALFGAHR